MPKPVWMPLLAVACLTACSGQRAATAEMSDLPGSVPSAAVSSWAPPQQLTAVTCDNVMAVLWPGGEGRPAAPGWAGPSCEEAENITLKWTYSSDDGAPEAADAAFVALGKAMRSNGWQVLVTADSETAAGVEMTEELVSPEGRHAEVIYTVAPNQATTLAVEFQR